MQALVESVIAEVVIIVLIAFLWLIIWSSLSIAAKADETMEQLMRKEKRGEAGLHTGPYSTRVIALRVSRHNASA